MDAFFRNVKAFLEEPWLGSVCLIVGGIWALILFWVSKKRERNNNELLNQPKFKFFDSMNTHGEIKRSCDTPENNMRPLPDFCDNPDCNRIHWFDIKNDGNFPAEDITISIALEGESDFKKRIKEREMSIKHLQAQESLQFSTEPQSVPDSLYEEKKDHDNLRFYVFVQYKSGYSKYWYKRVYQINANKVQRINLPEVRVSKKYEKCVWARGIELFGMNEKDCECQKDISFVGKLKAHVKSGRRGNSLSQYADFWVSDLFYACRFGKVCYFVKRIIHKK